MNNKRIVVKVGTSTLTHENGKLNLQRIDKLVQVLSDLRNMGNDVILVTSGAVGVGLSKIKIKSEERTMREKQAAAAIGQCELMFLYEKLFIQYGNNTAQILLTKDITDNKVGKENVINTINTLLEWGVIPVINENDSVAFEEIEFGDNDTLSALVSVLAGANLLILMTDIDGLYDKNPRENHDAKLISKVSEITETLKANAGGAGTRRGTGGMITKLLAAEIAMEKNIDMYIVNGEDPDNIYAAVKGEKVGTLFTTK